MLTKEFIQLSRFLGLVDVNLTCLKNESEVDGWFPLRTRKSSSLSASARPGTEVSGSLRLRLRWIHSDEGLTRYISEAVQNRYAELDYFFKIQRRFMRHLDRMGGDPKTQTMQASNAGGLTALGLPGFLLETGATGAAMVGNNLLYTMRATGGIVKNALALVPTAAGHVVRTLGQKAITGENLEANSSGRREDGSTTPTSVLGPEDRADTPDVDAMSPLTQSQGGSAYLNRSGLAGLFGTDNSPPDNLAADIENEDQDDISPFSPLAVDTGRPRSTPFAVQRIPFSALASDNYTEGSSAESVIEVRRRGDGDSRRRPLSTTSADINTGINSSLHGRSWYGGVTVSPRAGVSEGEFYGTPRSDLRGRKAQSMRLSTDFLREAQSALAAGGGGDRDRDRDRDSADLRFDAILEGEDEDNEVSARGSSLRMHADEMVPSRGGAYSRGQKSVVINDRVLTPASDPVSPLSQYQSQSQSPFDGIQRVRSLTLDGPPGLNRLSGAAHTTQRRPYVVIPPRSSKHEVAVRTWAIRTCGMQRPSITESKPTEMNRRNLCTHMQRRPELMADNKVRSHLNCRCLIAVDITA